jgi:hypothetical protein
VPVSEGVAYEVVARANVRVVDGVAGFEELPDDDVVVKDELQSSSSSGNSSRIAVNSSSSDVW